MGRLETEWKEGEWEREREKEPQAERQMSNRGLLSLEQKAGLKQTVQPSKLHILSVSSPSQFARPGPPFTLSSTGSTPHATVPSPLSPLPSPICLAGVGWGSKLQHSLCTSQAEKKQLQLTVPYMSSMFVFSKVRPTRAAKFKDIMWGS